MIVEQILNDNQKPIAAVGGSILICRIELTRKEAEAIIHSLSMTMCDGDELTASIMLEDKLLEVVENYR